LAAEAGAAPADGILSDFGSIIAAERPDLLLRSSFARGTPENRREPVQRWHILFPAAIAELSLPSRIPTIVASSHLPILVLGHAKTAAARFVARFNLGEVAPYEPWAARAALERISTAETQTQIRARAAELSAHFSSKGADDWIWKSLAAGAACDRRYEDLMPKIVL
jgi:hypothetical protein